MHSIIRASCIPATTAIHYGKLPIKQKNLNEKLFRNGDVKVMLATSSFAMGVNTENVEVVIIYGFVNKIRRIFKAN
jgi:replicative superfamily II helicase